MSRAETLAHERAYYTEYAREWRKRIEGGYLNELLPYPHFVVWRAETIDSQKKKPPYDPKHPGSRANVSDERTWW